MNCKSRAVSIFVCGALLVGAFLSGEAARADTVSPGPAPAAASTQTPAAGAPAAAAPGAAAQGAASAAAAPDTAGPAQPAADAAAAAAAPGAAASADPSSGEFKTLDQEVQGVKKDVIDLNKDLFVLEEELLFPANTQVAVYVSMDVGTFFALDSVTVKIDNKEVKNYLYTAREADALLKGGVQQIYLGNLKVGKHELVAFFTGKGPVERDYRRGATVNFDKGVGAKYLELKITDKVVKHQPEFQIKDWE
jgi:hypothetical protein